MNFEPSAAKFQVQRCKFKAPAPPSGFVAWWTGDGDPNDIIGGHHGALRGDATFAPGLVGQAFSLPQNGAHVEVLFGNDDFNFAPTQAMTLDMWVKRTSASEPLHLLGKRITCGPLTDIHYQLAEHTVSGGLVFGGAGGSVVAGTGRLPVGEWKHLAVTFDGTNFRFYIDGVLIATNAGAFQSPNSTPLLIGGSDGCATFIGLIDEVEIFNRALTAAEVQAIFNAGSAGKIHPA